MRFDELLRDLSSSGIVVWPSPDVRTKMGAKDALCRVADLSFGMEDTQMCADARAAPSRGMNVYARQCVPP